MPAPSKLAQILQPLLTDELGQRAELESAEGYSVELGEGVTLEISESPVGHLLLSCVLPTQPTRLSDTDTLRVLLQANLLGMDYPPVLTGLLPDRQQVVQWSSLPFHQLEPEVLQRLFNRFALQAEKLAAWLV
ncbi:CesT family type III secretion system chaperone [Cedecea neteri]|uniref:CesT family type III secretion system chaperone n=1 Tax=Cedecea neteri TaxID=158822 RepID=UPI0005DA228D|nr:CesT family type III secretion system chaperone [Cedecea neteri]AJZ90408.1 type III secretion chaperone CesT [Klebsiella michiganensis]WPU24369.1 CesT family type III secretion system chaperone [Cedecea neteri]